MYETSIITQIHRYSTVMSTKRKRQTQGETSVSDDSTHYKILSDSGALQFIVQKQVNKYETISQ